MIDSIPLSTGSVPINRDSTRGYSPPPLRGFHIPGAQGSTVTAVPDNGFTTINSLNNAFDAVETFVVTRDVTAPGAYNVDWAVTPNQGAQM